MDETNDAIMFCITTEDQDKINAWLKDTVTPSGIAKQKLVVTPDHPDYSLYRLCWDSGYAYTGAIGGSISYIFTPTSIGVVLKVKDGLTGLELDMTDYDSW